MCAVSEYQHLSAVWLWFLSHLTQTRAAPGLKPLCLPCIHFLTSRHIVSKLSRGCGSCQGLMMIPLSHRNHCDSSRFDLRPLRDCPNNISICTSGPKRAKNREFSQLLSHSTVPVPLSINHHYLCPGAHLHKNNPKTLWYGPVAGRTERGNADFVKHEKAKTGRVERCMAP